MVTNAWHLDDSMDSSLDPGCRLLNLCELGYNGAVWGDVSLMVAELGALVLARWRSADREEEEYLRSGIRYSTYNDDCHRVIEYDEILMRI